MAEQKVINGLSSLIGKQVCEQPLADYMANVELVTKLVKMKKWKRFNIVLTEYPSVANTLTSLDSCLPVDAYKELLTLPMIDLCQLFQFIGLNIVQYGTVQDVVTLKLEMDKVPNLYDHVVGIVALTLFVLTTAPAMQVQKDVWNAFMDGSTIFSPAQIAIFQARICKT